jgi:hypothetical protein
MKHSYFEIDGAIGKLQHYQFKPEYKKVIIKFSTRTYAHSFDEMEEVFKTWKPINTSDQLEYIPLEDHNTGNNTSVINADEVVQAEPSLGIEPQETDEINKLDLDQSTFDVTLENTFSVALQQMMASANFVNKRLEAAILRLNQEGEKGKAYVPQATQIIKASNAMKLNRDSVIEMIKAGINMSKERNKKSKPNDAKKSNSNQKD